MIFSTKRVTPNPDSVPEIPAVNIKTKISKLAALDKRTYPLNCKPQRTEVILQKSVKKVNKVPEFMSDFLKDANRYHVRAKSCVKSFRPPKPPEPVSDVQKTDTFKETSKNIIPTVSYKMFKRKLS